MNPFSPQAHKPIFCPRTYITSFNIDKTFQWRQRKWLGDRKTAANCVCFLALFVTYFVYNISATVSYHQKRASSYQDSYYSPRIRQSEAKDLRIQTPDKTQIHTKKEILGM